MGTHPIFESDFDCLTEMADIDIVDFKLDVHLNESTKLPRHIISFGNKDEIENITENIIGYSLFDSDDIADIEDSFDQMTQRATKGKLRVDTVNVEKRERRVNYQFGRGYKMGRHSDEVARLKNDVDVSPIPDWIQTKVIDKMVKAKLVPPDWIDSIEINDYRKGGFKVPCVDPVSLFLRPSFTIPLLSDGALCFGAKYYYDQEPVFSDPRFRLPAYRGVLFKMQGYASDKMNHCIRSCDTIERFVTITLRRTCDDAQYLKALSKGQSLRNFDDVALSKLKRAIDESKKGYTMQPYIRNFDIIAAKDDENVDTSRKRKKKGLSFLKDKKRSRNRSASPPSKLPQKTKEDERWKFGNSPDRVKTEWSSDEEFDKRTGQKRTKYKEAKRTNDVTDILLEYGQRKSQERDIDYKQIEREVHMKKSRKERGREFREKVNAKFGFKPEVVRSSDSESDSDDQNDQKNTKSKRIKPFHL